MIKMDIIMSLSKKIASAGIVDSVKYVSETPKDHLTIYWFDTFCNFYEPEIISEEHANDISTTLPIDKEYTTLSHKILNAAVQRCKYHLKKLSKKTAFFYRLDKNRIEDTDYRPKIMDRILEKISFELKVCEGSCYKMLVSDMPVKLQNLQPPESDAPPPIE